MRRAATEIVDEMSCEPATKRARQTETTAMPITTPYVPPSTSSDDETSSVNSEPSQKHWRDDLIGVHALLARSVKDLSALSTEKHVLIGDVDVTSALL
ncbi:hypothetical protein HDU86_002833 [Geranomyces michiganensis]|nr:hypothetical protein HDU86_002833 [Geranomyces michiganensis]